MYVLSILAADETKSGGSILGILPLLLIPVAMYFLMIRPQRRRQREAAALQSAIEVGDEIMTTSGIYGFVTGFEGDIAWLEIDDNVQIRISRAAIQRRVDTSAADGSIEVADADKSAKSDRVKPDSVTSGSSTNTSVDQIILNDGDANN
ncbi:MAG TPA: preprotein translocase subunit YajC [Ilumatobacteraceae bacterium]|nr:preprotein translocase subunit YajC [Ilumatobacteraceae bacterium]